MNSIWQISGVNVGVFSDQQLVIEPFSAWMWNTGSGVTGDIIDLNTTLYPDLRTVGLNGMDVNPNGSGNMPPDGCYDIYMIYNPTTLDVGFICTLSGSWTTVVKPSGYTWYRKLMYGVLVRNGKLAANHTAHWPMPKIILTDVETNRIVFSGGSTGAWTLVDLSKWMPENSRLGHFRGRIAGGNGSMWISPSNNVPNLMFRTLQEGAGTSGVVDCRVDGNEHIYVWTQGTATYQLFFEGWSQTEVS